MSDTVRDGLARAIRDAYATDIIPADTLLSDDGWSGLVGSVEEWHPEADAALAYLAARPAVDAEVARLRAWKENAQTTLDADKAVMGRDAAEVARLTAAVERVRVLHRPVNVYPLLDLPGNPPDDGADPMAVLCSGCTPADVLIEVEDWTWQESDRDVFWPCSTLAALDGAE